ncbi:MAG: hypothetical protein EHM77_07770, partial [Planctomycetaceae bacterium]
MMKFPRPRILLENEYPDLTDSQPELFHDMVTNFVHPEPESSIDNYINSTVEFLKNQQRQKQLSAKLNNVNLANNLFFVYLTLPPNKEKIKCLVDTGASNSLLHSSIADKLKIPIEPA